MIINVVNKYKVKDNIYCGRGSALGNPFKMENESMRDEVCEQYEKYFYETLIHKEDSIKQLNFIEDKLKNNLEVNLGCFCAPKRCHCDTIKNYILKKINN